MNGNEIDMKRTNDKLKKGMWLLSRKAIKNALANAFISRVRKYKNYGLDRYKKGITQR